MCSIQELPDVKAKILEKVKLSVQDADISALSNWSKAAEQCEKFIQESSDLTSRVKNFMDTLWHARDIDLTEQSLISTPKIKMSPKLEGSKARRGWVSMLSSKGILLNGHNKRYYTKSGQSVGIAFANEIDRPNLIDKWFLGLKDEPTDVVVLLCRDLEGNLNDVILPVAELNSTWKTLSRSGGQVKFNVRSRQGEYFLLDPNGEALNISKYRGKYQVLK
ncbi:hypothetical protein BMS3Abin10_00556 [bacterium BMS3Abin10]|nr:hypothetical protein BMS3Abin10_00556 [bacterium BMS3Abin10]GBE37778.1 hypothetical protein BMS3Bbin08_00375 [bacterium BMS3Bbin08]HDH07824.1 hypothetical protein [Candidatus Moranbacteria bacterium]